VANVTFVTLFRLAERLGAASLAATGRRPASTPVLAQAFRAILAADPRVFAQVADHPATELALMASTRELAGVTDAALDAVAACGVRAADVVRVARQVRNDLALARYDEHELLRAATAAVNDAASVGPLVVHLLKGLSRPARNCSAPWRDISRFSSTWARLETALPINTCWPPTPAPASPSSGVESDGQRSTCGPKA
jgi:hypothetical protein